ncbi:hypothetical protein Peur_032724 [Populus x canadensis]
MLPGLLFQVHRFHDWVTDVLEQSKCTFQFKGPWFGDMDMLVTADPANTHYIMNSKFSNFEKGSDFNKRFDILGDGIINADRDLWKNQRRVAQALVNHRLFYQRLVKTIQDKVERGLIPVLEHVYKQSLALDLQDLFQRFTFDATCVIVTGFDPGCLSIDLPEVAFSKAMDNAMEAIFYRHVLPESTWRLQRWLGIGKEKKLKKARETLDRIIAEIISMKREELSKGKRLMEEDGEGIDLLTSYMSEDYNMGFKSDDEFLRETIVTFMLAGRDTVSSCLSWFFWLVSKNPAAGAKIREELKTTLPEKEAEKRRLFDIEEIKKLVYLHGALCESLRLYPPIHSEFKSPLRQDILPSGHRVNPKTKIVFSLYAMGRMSSVWGDDCFEFKPERWITGPRTCRGKDVAFTQMKAVVAAIIYNYQTVGSSCAYTVVISTSCLSPKYTTDQISIIFGDAFGNQVYDSKLVNPFTITFEQCSTNTFQVTGSCSLEICYVYFYRNGTVGWIPQSVEIYGSFSTPAVFFFNSTTVPEGEWRGDSILQQYDHSLFLASLLLLFAISGLLNSTKRPL